MHGVFVERNQAKTHEVFFDFPGGEVAGEVFDLETKAALFLDNQPEAPGKPRSSSLERSGRCRIVLPVRRQVYYVG